MLGRTLIVTAASGGRAPLRRRMMNVARAHSASAASISVSFSSAVAWCLLEAWIPWKHNLIFRLLFNAGCPDPLTSFLTKFLRHRDQQIVPDANGRLPHLTRACTAADARYLPQ
jgi:hypothetical protein